MAPTSARQPTPPRTPRRMPGAGRRLFWPLLAALVVAFAPGCRYVPGIVPPFDATGKYRAVWTGLINEEFEQSCALTLDFQHDTNGFLPGSSVLEADVTLNLSCPGVYRLLEDTGLPAIHTVPVRGYVSANGRVYLGAVQTTARYQLAVGIDAQGRDDDRDGRMDRLDGDFNFVVRVRGSEVVTVRATLSAETDRV